jgi:hypothetical protein
MIKIFFVALALLGLATSIFGVYFIGLSRQAAHWPKTSGQVISTQVHTDHSQTDRGLTAAQRARSQRYYPVIHYQWNVDGKTYSGSRYRLGTTYEKFKRREHAQSAAAQYPAQSALTVYYDARNPAQAVLEPAASMGVYVPLPLGLLFLGVGLLGLRFLPHLQQAVPD